MCSTTSDNQGTPGYKAPEIYREQDFDPIKVDIWALAITLFRLSSRECAFGLDEERMIPYDAVLQDGEYL